MCTIVPFGHPKNNDLNNFDSFTSWFQQISRSISLIILFTGYLLPFRKPKRVRTAFSPTQLLKLEHAFENNHYVVGAERKSLAQALGLTETQVCSFTQFINIFDCQVIKIKPIIAVDQLDFQRTFSGLEQCTAWANESTIA